MLINVRIIVLFTGVVLDASTDARVRKDSLSSRLLSLQSLKSHHGANIVDLLDNGSLDLSD